MALAEVLKESSSPSIRLAALKARLNFAMFKLIIVDAPKRTGTITIYKYIMFLLNFIEIFSCFWLFAYTLHYTLTDLKVIRKRLAATFALIFLKC